jgi:glycosyltransferase involved in cell wall biosynthesis
MKILLACDSFARLTGSELYNFELSRSLVGIGHSVTVVSKNVYGELPDRALADGVRVLSLPDAVKIKDEAFDIAQTSQPGSTHTVMALFKNLPIIQTIHSEVTPYERPVVGKGVVHYIAIRVSIKDDLIKNHGIPEDKISVVFNPIDFSRFNTISCKTNNPPIFLFVGTNDWVRSEAVLSLISVSSKIGGKAIVIGDGWGRVKSPNPELSEFHPATYDIEKYVKNCDYTASVMMGRTTIEGWCCGKTGIIFEIDKSGKVINDYRMPPPDDLSKFDSSLVAKQLTEIYLKCLNR